MFIKPEIRVCKLKEKNIIGGSDEHINYPINPLLCSEIRDENYTIGNHKYYSIFFKGVESRWLYVKQEDRDRQFQKLIEYNG